MKKVVLKLDLHDERGKQRAMKAVSGLPGIESIAIELKDSKLTVIGDVDPINVVNKLRKKQWFVEILTVGPKEEKKPEDKKKEEEKKKAEEKKKEEEKKKAEEKKKEDEKKKDPVAEWVKAYQAYNPHLTTHYHVMSAEENPNACVIC